MRGRGNCKFYYENTQHENKLFCSYYINHYTKTTTWEDPRDRYQQIGKAGSKEKENTRPGADREEAGLHQTSSMAPLANQQVASMRRELEAEQVIGQNIFFPFHYCHMSGIKKSKGKQSSKWKV